MSVAPGITPTTSVPCFASSARTPCVISRPAALERTVGAVSRQADPAEDGQHVDDCAAAVGLEDRRECAGHGKGAEKIGIELGARVIRVLTGDDAGLQIDAGIVDQQRHVAALLRCGRDLRIVGNVELQRLDFAGMRRDQVRYFGWIARGGVNLFRAFGDQCFDEIPADAPAAAGHQRHCSSIFIFPVSFLLFMLFVLPRRD